MEAITNVKQNRNVFMVAISLAVLSLAVCLSLLFNGVLYFAHIIYTLDEPLKGLLEETT